MFTSEAHCVVRNVRRETAKSDGIVFIFTAIFSIAIPFTSPAQIYKTNDNAALNVGTSWIGNVAPGSGNVAAWDATVATPANCTNTLSASVNWGGILISNPVVAVKILTNNNPTISIGSSGINLSNATANLWIAPALTTVADQNWTITNGLTLMLGEAGQNVTIANNVTINGSILFPNAITINSGGSLTISNGASFVSTITNNAVTSITVDGVLNQMGGVVKVGRSDSTSGSPKATLSLAGTGICNISGGSFIDGSSTSDGRVDVGTSTGDLGTLNVSGNASLQLQSLYIANGGNGIVNVTNGNMTVTINTIRVGTGNNGGTGTMNVYDGTVSAIAGINVQHSTSAGADTGILNLYGGNIFVGGALNVPNGIGNGRVTVSGGLLMVTNYLNLPNNAAGNGTINLNGGILVASSIDHPAAGSGTLILNGGILKPAGNNVSYIASGVIVDVGTNGAMVDTTNFNVTILPPLLNGTGSADSGLAKMGAGTLTLAGVNTYNGPTVVNAGILIATNLGSIADSTNIFIASGATLNISGSGTLTVNATPTLAGTLVMQISKKGTMLGNDKLTFPGGTINYDGTLIVTATGNFLAAGDAFDLFDANSFGGGFVTISLPSLPNNLSWDTSRLNLDGSIQVITNNAIPSIPPSFSSIMLQDGTNMIINGSGGTSNGIYYVLSSTNVALPLTNWTMIGGSNWFDVNGNFNFTNAVNPAFSAQFFALSLSPQTLSESDSIILQALQNMRDEGFNTYLPTPGGLWVNWIYTNNPPVNQSMGNINYNGQPDSDPTTRHDRLTDIVYLADLVLYKQLNPLDTQFDAEINRYTNICQSPANDHFLTSPDQRGWVYWVLQEISSGIPSFTNSYNAQADKYYNIYTNNLIKNYNNQVTPLYIDWNTNDDAGLHGTYTVNLVVEDACVLIVNGKVRNLTNYVAAGESLMAFAQSNAYSSTLNMWADTMGNLFTTTNQIGGTVSPPNQQVIYNTSEETSEIGEMTEALCRAEAADPGKGYGALALATLNKLDPLTNSFGLWDTNYGGYYADLILNGTNIQSPTLTASVNSSYKEVGRAAIVIRSFIFANEFAGANYDPHIIVALENANLNSYYIVGHGWPYQENDDYSLYLDNGSGYSILQNWVTSESISHAVRALLTYELPIPQ